MINRRKFLTTGALALSVGVLIIEILPLKKERKQKLIIDPEGKKFSYINGKIVLNTDDL